MALNPAKLPDDIAVLKAMLLDRDAEIVTLKLTIAKLRHARFGVSSEHGSRLIDQLELQLAEMVERRSEETTTAEIASPPEDLHEARKPARRPLPDHLPRERKLHASPMQCSCCGGTSFRKLGEDVTETLERVPASWKVIQHVRERIACRACDTVLQTPAPTHPIARGRAGPQLLADVLFGKYGAHLPLNRQSEIYAAEGVDLDVSTLADWVGAAAATLMPLRDEIEKHVLAAERIHADDTTVPVLAKGQCTTGRLWTYVRDDRPFAGSADAGGHAERQQRAAPAALYHYSPNRQGEHPERHLATFSGLLQADAYAGFKGLYNAGRKPGPIFEAACWAHGRRKFFELAALKKMPLAIEAVKRIDVLFAIERDINGKPPDRRLAVRQQRSRPLVEDLERWLRDERRKLSAKNPLAKAINYSLKRWPAFTRFLDDGRICLSNNAAERALRGIAVGRRNWTFCGSDRGGQRAAVILTLVETAKLNGVDPRAYLADILARIGDHPAKRITELLPWNWDAPATAQAMAA